MISNRTLEIIQLVIKFGHFAYVYPFTLQSPNYKIIFEAKRMKWFRWKIYSTLSVQFALFIYLLLQTWIYYEDRPSFILSIVLSFVVLGALLTQAFWFDRMVSIIELTNNCFYFNHIQGSVFIQKLF